MNHRNISRLSLLVSLPILTSLAFGLAWGCSHSKSSGVNEGAGDKETVTATIKVAAMKKGTLESNISAFGSIVPAPGASQTISVAYECRVASIVVSEGQMVATGTPLLAVTDSPDALLALEQARIDERATEAQLQQIRKRHALKLADNGQLAQAEQAFDSAQARLKSLEARHLGGPQALAAKAPGVVTRIPVQVGAVLPPGSSLVELADTQHLESKLGVESKDAAHLRQGGAVTLSIVDGKSILTAQAHIRTVSPAINPTTRLVDVFVSLPPGHSFLLGQYVNGKVFVATHEGLIVPYAAVLPDEGRYILFTVKNGHAVRHEVQVLLQNGDRVQVAGPELDAADPVVIQGNYELQDGMAVLVEQAR
jgi:RND family efflux transporter MFP subunit